MRAIRSKATLNRHRFIAAFAIAIVATLASSALTGTAATATPDTIVLSGHVFLGDATTSAGINEVGIAYRVWQPQWFTTSDLAKTDANGDFQITVSAPAILALEFHYLGSGNYVDGTTSTSTNPADPGLKYTTDTSGIDITLAPGASIGGTVTDSAGNPVPGISAVAVREGSLDGERTYSSYSDVDGHYLVTGLPAGDYRMKFVDTRPAGPFPNAQKCTTQWWQSSMLNIAGASPMPLAAGEAADGIDMSLIDLGIEEVRIGCDYCDAHFLWNTGVDLSLSRVRVHTGDLDAIELQLAPASLALYAVPRALSGDVPGAGKDQESALCRRSLT